MHIHMRMHIHIHIHIQYTLYTIHYTLYTVHCTLYTIHYTQVHTTVMAVAAGAVEFILAGLGNGD